MSESECARPCRVACRPWAGGRSTPTSERSTSAPKRAMRASSSSMWVMISLSMNRCAVWCLVGVNATAKLKWRKELPGWDHQARRHVSSPEVCKTLEHIGVDARARALPRHMDPRALRAQSTFSDQRCCHPPGTAAQSPGCGDVLTCPRHAISRLMRLNCLSVKKVRCAPPPTLLPAPVCCRRVKCAAGIPLTAAGSRGGERSSAHARY